MRESFWNERRDRILTALQSAGKSCSYIAEVVGTTRNAVIARSNRIKGVRFPSDTKRRKKASQEAQQRRVERKRVEKAAIDAMKTMLERSGRDEAISTAVKGGATLESVGKVVGLSRERVRQIAALT